MQYWIMWSLVSLRKSTAKTNLLCLKTINKFKFEQVTEKAISLLALSQPKPTMTLISNLVIKISNFFLNGNQV